MSCHVLQQIHSSGRDAVVVSSGGMIACHLHAELQGMQRVLGALEAHMWPGLHMKPQLSGQGSGGRDSVLAAAATAGDRHSGQHGSQQSASSQLPISTAGPAGHATLNPKGTDAGAGATAGADQLPGGADVGEPFGAFLSGEDADSDDEADRKFAKLMGQLAGAIQHGASSIRTSK